MSKNEWERGSITLPAREVAPLHKALREHVNASHTAVRERAIALHKQFGTRSLERYGETLRARQPASDTVTSLALEVLNRIYFDAQRGGKGLHSPTLADVDAVIARVTNRTPTFTAYGEWGEGLATIHFAGRVVTWTVSENNRAVERAHESALGKVFFAQLDRIEWGTSSKVGGFGWGNDEYNQDPSNGYGPGGGADYVTFTYGPRGEAERAHSVGLTLAAYRKLRSAR